MDDRGRGVESVVLGNIMVILVMVVLEEMERFLETAGKLQVSRPRTSLSGGHLCCTAIEATEEPIRNKPNSSNLQPAS